MQFISKISRAYLTVFFNDVEEHEFPSNLPNHSTNGGIDFLYSYLTFTAAYSLKSERNLACGFCETVKPRV